MNTEQILEWYLLAGVDETCGDVPFAPIPQAEFARPSAVVASSPSAATRPATTELSQDTLGACQTAQDLCAQINNLEDLRKAVENFEGCALKLNASHTVFGGGNSKADILLIGEAPGADEDRIGEPFVGRSGQLLDKMMASIGLTRDNFYICNVLPWRPPGNRTPMDSEIAVCLPFLKRQIDLVDPDYILILGASASNTLLDTTDPISHLRGHWHEYRKSNGKISRVLATYHPAYLLRSGGQKSKAWSDLLRLKKELINESSAEVN